MSANSKYSCTDDAPGAALLTQDDIDDEVSSTSTPGNGMKLNEVLNFFLSQGDMPPNLSAMIVAVTAKHDANNHANLNQLSLNRRLFYERQQAINENMPYLSQDRKKQIEIASAKAYINTNKYYCPRDWASNQDQIVKQRKKLFENKEIKADNKAAVEMTVTNDRLKIKDNINSEHKKRRRRKGNRKCSGKKSILYSALHKDKSIGRHCNKSPLQKR